MRLGRNPGSPQHPSLQQQTPSQERHAYWSRMAEPLRQQFVWPQPGAPRTLEDLTDGREASWAGHGTQLAGAGWGVLDHPPPPQIPRHQGGKTSHAVPSPCAGPWATSSPPRDFCVGGFYSPQGGRRALAVQHPAGLEPGCGWQVAAGERQPLTGRSTNAAEQRPATTAITDKNA